MWRCLTATSPGVISPVSPLVEPTAVGPRRSRRQAPGGGGTPRNRGEVETIVVVVGFSCTTRNIVKVGSAPTGRGENIVFCSDFLRPFHRADTVRQRAEHREGAAALPLLRQRGCSVFYLQLEQLWEGTPTEDRNGGEAPGVVRWTQEQRRGRGRRGANRRRVPRSPRG